MRTIGIIQSAADVCDLLADETALTIGVKPRDGVWGWRIGT